jgi:imidazoleglycerol-phosphate dehydratase
MPTELLEDFFRALADNLKANIHINLRYGRNEHHKIEAIFKAFGRALRAAIEKNPRLKGFVPSTKGRI